MSSARVPGTSSSRRAFLRGSSASIAVLAVGAPLLSACSSGSAGQAATGAKAVELPTFTPLSVAKPDLAGAAAGVEPGYLSFPAKASKTVTKAPGSGARVRALVSTFTPPPPPLAKNDYWQQMNKALGVDMKMEITPAADYPSKFSSVMAGSDIPDLVQAPLFMPLPRLTELLESRFADLSDHLAGDKVADYPNLANLPTYAWRNARIAGRLYGVPVTRPLFAGPLFYRLDLFDKQNLSARPANSDDFTALCKELTAAKSRRWALGSGESSRFNIDYFAQIFGAPRRWAKADDGTLTRDVESEEYISALEYARSLNKAGYFHPDTASMSAVQAKDHFAAGRIAMFADGTAAWRAFYDVYGARTPGLKVGAFLPFAASGGKVQHYLDRGAYSITAIKKSDDKRIRELLGVLNFLAAPFGSREYLLRVYGTEGVGFTRDKEGLPVLTERGKSEQGTPFSYVMSAPSVLFHARYPQWVRDQHEWETKTAPAGVADPTLGLYSETQGRNTDLDKLLSDAAVAVVSGRSPVSSFTATVKRWRQSGGDKIRKELQKELDRA